MQNYKEYHYYLRVAATLLMAILMIVMGTSQMSDENFLIASIPLLTGMAALCIGISMLVYLKNELLGSIISLTGRILFWFTEKAAESPVPLGRG
jgi:hypothetical protein